MTDASLTRYIAFDKVGMAACLVSDRRRADKHAAQISGYVLKASRLVTDYRPTKPKANPHAWRLTSADGSKRWPFKSKKTARAFLAGLKESHRFGRAPYEFILMKFDSASDTYRECERYNLNNKFDYSDLLRQPGDS